MIQRLEEIAWIRANAHTNNISGQLVAFASAALL
jgi:hypothetical protein